MESAQQEVRRLLDQIRAVSNSPAVERASDQIEVLCRAYMEPDQFGVEEGLGLHKGFAKIFNLLHKRRGSIVSQDALMCAMWPRGDEPDTALNNLRVHVCHLRHRIRTHGYEIENVWGAGYRMTKWPEPEKAAS